MKCKCLLVLLASYFILASGSLIGSPTARSSFAKSLRPSPRYRQPAPLPFQPHELHRTILKRRLADVKAGRSLNEFDGLTYSHQRHITRSLNHHLPPIGHPRIKLPLQDCHHHHTYTTPHHLNRKVDDTCGRSLLLSCQCCTDKLKTYLAFLDVDERATPTIKGRMHIRRITDAPQLSQHIGVNDNYRLEF